jgi:uncharacterized protein YdhG (YjbR/CyaY superfamily)
VSKYANTAEYLATIPEERLSAYTQLRDIINNNIDKGFKECISYNMPGWVVPLESYPDGYHCKADTPLPFASLANQKGFIAVYHMGVYADEKLYDWFVNAYPQHSKRKLDMGKSCIRFKKMDDIPYELIGQLMKKMTMKQWVSLYEKHIKK